MRVYIYLLFCLTSRTIVFCQDRIITRENDKIPGKITSASGQLIRFVNRFTTRPDSIATELVQEIRYNDDSLRVLVVPEEYRNQFTPITPGEFSEAIDLNDYALLLQSKTERYDLSFTTAATGKAVRLTPDSKARLAAWISLFKAHPEFSFAITVHTDAGGSAALNQLITENRANALRTFLLSRGILPATIRVTGRGDSESVNGTPSHNRRIEFRCTAAKGISILYALPYTAPKPPEGTRSAPVSVQVPASPTPAVQTYAPSQPAEVRIRTPKPYSVTAYVEGIYTFQLLSLNWVDPDKGPGILQGFGGGALFTYYLKPRINLVAQLGYSSWAVRRRYLDEKQVVQFSNDQLLSRLTAQVGVRLYATSAVYIQPLVGVQQLTLTSQNSTTHPYGVNKIVNNAILPSVGTDIGYSFKRKNRLMDVAAQYYLIPNKAFVGVQQALHFFGLRVGIGFRPENK